MRRTGCKVDQLIERERDHRLVERRRAAVAVIDEGHDHRKSRHTVYRRARRIREVESAHLTHAGDKQARIESADHVAPTLVLAGAKVAAVEDPGVRVNAAAVVALEAGRAPQ